MIKAFALVIPFARQIRAISINAHPFPALHTILMSSIRCPDSHRSLSTDMTRKDSPDLNKEATAWDMSAEYNCRTVSLLRLGASGRSYLSDSHRRFASSFQKNHVYFLWRSRVTFENSPRVRMLSYFSDSLDRFPDVALGQGWQRCMLGNIEDPVAAVARAGFELRPRQHHYASGIPRTYPASRLSNSRLMMLPKRSPRKDRRATYPDS